MVCFHISSLNKNNAKNIGSDLLMSVFKLRIRNTIMTVSETPGSVYSLLFGTFVYMNIDHISLNLHITRICKVKTE